MASRWWAGMRPRTGVLTGRARAYMVVLGCRHLSIGLFALLWPSTFKGSSFDVVRHVLALQMWGAVFVVVGCNALVVAGYGREMHARFLIGLSAVVTGMWAAGLGVAGVEGHLVSPTLPITWAALLAKDLVVASMPLRMPVVELETNGGR